MMSDVAPRFDSDAYWSSRLADHWDLQGVGHLEYPPSYNRWLYRRKRRVLRRGLDDAPRADVLDLGSGTGWVMAELRAAGATHLTGCELTEVGVARLRAAMPDADFHRVDLARATLPAGDCSIDVTTMLDVAYHLVEDDGLRHCVGEVARVLRPRAIALVTDAFGDAGHRPAEHVVFRSRPQWDAILAGTGLSVERTLPYFRTLSRPRDATWRHRWHPRIRGPVEWAMDTALPLRPWLRLAVLRRTEPEG